MSAHTLGPWKWHAAKHDDGRNNGSVISGADTGLAYCICKAPQFATEKDWAANARLIAAAPELLDACEGLLSALDEDCQSPSRRDELMFAARAAVAKARGTE